MIAPRLDCFDLTRAARANDDHRALQAALQRFVEAEVTPNGDAWDEAGTFPRELYKKASDVGLIGLGYPAEHGGTPTDSLGRLIATTELCRAGIGGVNASLNSYTIMIWPVLAAAQPAVREQVTRDIFSGEKIGALAITEASGGSDVAQLRTRAERVPGGWKLNGSKIYITSGVRADYILVAARTGGPGAGGVSLFLINGEWQGVSRTPLRKTGWWASDTAQLFFDDVFVPDERMVGEEGRGFSLIMKNFNGERLGMAGGCMAYAMVCVEDTLAWARERETFGKRLVEHQVVRQKIVRMIDAILPLQHWLLDLGRRVDEGESPVAEIALASRASLMKP